MLRMLVLACVLARAAGQVSKTIASADNSVTDIVPLYDNRAARAWLGPNGMHELFLQLDAARLTLALDAAPLVGNATAAAIADALSTDDACAVAPDPAVYMANATAYQAFLCCQLAPWQLPGMPAVVAAVYAHFLPGAPALEWSAATGVAAVAQIRALDTNSTNIYRCKDDTRIHVPESQLIQARTVASVAGQVLRSLQVAAEVLQAVAACLGATPPAACLASTPSPLSAGTAAAMLAFYQASPPYQQTCGTPALVAFEAFRTSTTWCYIP